MIKTFSLIHNASLTQNKFNELSGEIYLIISFDTVWLMWKTLFEKYEAGELIDPDTCMLFRWTSHFKQLKPFIQKFFRTLQCLTKTEMGNAADHIMHVKPTPKRYWVYPKIVFTKPKSFVL